jgi:hypothetical protein
VFLFVVPAAMMSMVESLWFCVFVVSFLVLSRSAGVECVAVCSMMRPQLVLSVRHSLSLVVMIVGTAVIGRVVDVPVMVLLAVECVRR